MYRPPLDPRDEPAINSPRSIAVAYATIPMFILVLWAVSQPLAAAVALATLIGLSIGVRRLLWLTRCLRDCGEYALDLGGRVRITITKPAGHR